MTGPKIAALSFRLPNGSQARIYPCGAFDKIAWDNPLDCSLSDAYFQALSSFCTYPYLSDSEPQKAEICIVQAADGSNCLRLVETKRYIAKVDASKEGKGRKPQPHLFNEGNRFLKIERDESLLVFQFVNYLGRSKLTFQNLGEEREALLWFDVVPDKFSYEDDYIELTKAIAERCSRLLMDYSGPTFNEYRLTENSSRNSLLEQFIFLRQFCYSENICGLFEAIKRNPSVQFAKREEFRPASLSRPSHRFFTNPILFGRGWKRGHTAGGELRTVPQEVLTTQKYETFDTPANRFILYALNLFLDICNRLIESLQELGEEQVECLREAEFFRNNLEEILCDGFFDEVKPLEIIPQNNQVLQKREGYSQIFSAFSMLDMALQLDWRGKEDAYLGETKNVALLYEYWLFFELRSIILSIKDCKQVELKERDFIQTNDGKLRINLRKGKESVQGFKIPCWKTNINLYYNRTFEPADFKQTEYKGSYSWKFQPDFTLAIFPEMYSGKDNGEEEALLDGAVSYIHFDAKYRIDDIAKQLGSDAVGEVSESENSESILQERKTEAVIHTFKDGDLLKMHAYRDAIRRTAGSYVLYPGDEGKDKIFRLYEEIIPGVGAFSYKPSGREESRKGLKEFLINLIQANQSLSSRFNRSSFFNEMVIRDPSCESLALNDSSFSTENRHGRDYFILGKADEYKRYLESQGHLSKGRVFPYHIPAIRNGVVYSHHKDLAKAKYFKFIDTSPNGEDGYKLNPFTCSVISYSLVSREELESKYKEFGYRKYTDLNEEGSFYFLLELKVIGADEFTTYLDKRTVEIENGNDAFSPNTPWVVSLLIHK